MRNCGDWLRRTIGVGGTKATTSSVFARYSMLQSGAISQLCGGSVVLLLRASTIERSLLWRGGGIGRKLVSVWQESRHGRRVQKFDR